MHDDLNHRRTGVQDDGDGGGRTLPCRCPILHGVQQGMGASLSGYTLGITEQVHRDRLR